MPSEMSNIIKIFSKFLDPEFSDIKKIKKIDDILKLPIYAYNFLDKEDAAIFGEILGINNIKDAAKLDKNEPLELPINFESSTDPIASNEISQEKKLKIEDIRQKLPDLEKKLRKTATISSLIKKIKKETLEEKKDQKVVVVGLDNAGKTAIISKFGGHLGISDLASLKPTKGIKREHIKTDTLDLYIWDFGGQEEFRKKYVQDPEKYFLQIDLLIYVVDIQDPDRFEESLGYFSNILELLILLEENPYIMIYIHKYDPDIKSKPEILLNIEFLKDNLKEIFQVRKDFGFDYEIYLTSIFSLISNEPKFAKYIKDIMKTNYALTDPTISKVEGLGKILEETMNVIIRLSESISTQIDNIENRLGAIENGAYQAFQLKSVQSGVPIEIKSPEVVEVKRREASARFQVLNELKDLFAKKRSLDL